MDRNRFLSDDFLEALKAISPDERKKMVEGDWSSFKEDKYVRAIRDDLSDIQREYLGAIGWFFYGPRASGRTFLSCSAAIITAINNPNEWIEIHDHYKRPHHREYIARMLVEIVHKHNLDDKFEFSFYSSSSPMNIKYIPKDKNDKDKR